MKEEPQEKLQSNGRIKDEVSEQGPNNTERSLKLRRRDAPVGLVTGRSGLLFRAGHFPCSTPSTFPRSIASSPGWVKLLSADQHAPTE